MDGIVLSNARLFYATVCLKSGSDNKIRSCGMAFYKNGSAIVSNFGLSTTGQTLVFPSTTYYSGGYCSYNFGNASYTISSGNSDADGFGNFEYSVPSGYFALCTKNLAEYG